MNHRDEIRANSISVPMERELYEFVASEAKKSERSMAATIRCWINERKEGIK